MNYRFSSLSCIWISLSDGRSSLLSSVELCVLEIFSRHACLDWSHRAFSSTSTVCERFWESQCSSVIFTQRNLFGTVNLALWTVCLYTLILPTRDPLFFLEDSVAEADRPQPISVFVWDNGRIVLSTGIVTLP